MPETPIGTTVHRVLNVRGRCTDILYMHLPQQSVGGSWSSSLSPWVQQLALLSSFAAVFGDFWHHPNIRTLPHFEDILRSRCE